jgi:preprotein translocase subunit SecD
MKRHASSLAWAFAAVATPLLLLSACKPQASLINYRLQFDVTDPAIRTELASASMRVIERRVETAGGKVETKTVEPSGDHAMLRFSLSDPKLTLPLQGQLTVPFQLRLMREARKGETPAVSIEGHGSFVETGITEDHLEWIQPEADPTTGKGKVTMIFSPDGRKLMEKIFKENKGKYLALFVRGRLISKLFVNTDKLDENIVISDIPTKELATIFADDVNVGLHVQFVPGT